MANLLFPGAFPTPNIPKLGIGQGQGQGQGRGGATMQQGGGQPNQAGGGGSGMNGLPGLPQMPANLNQQLAPSTPYQDMALGGFGPATQGALQAAEGGLSTLGNFASGANLSPQSNPNLAAYYNAAAGPMVQNYQNAVMPGIQAQGAQTGSVGGTGYNTAIGQAQYGLGQGLGTLGANIYEPAYQQGQQLQYGAAQALPGAGMSLYSPLSALYGAGATQQQGAQNQLNTNYQNALSQFQFPYQMLGQLGQAFGATSGAGGTTVSMAPSMGGSSGSKM